MSNLPRDQRHPTPLTHADLRALGIPVEVLRGLAALAPYPAAAHSVPSIVQPSIYHVVKKESGRGTA
ncbi:hypothetical protein HGO34_15140 [Agrobacterium vitis]|uniref:Uncharacterized protein n=1 Tax=Agrobacterium vitis TaxID=373 RepID=A0AAE4WEN3_AGRVI|nr:hypothetical protein [Agrobacterium vitis]MCF1499040.1 hypothetical protein [Allorhizobium sp. Av2]MCM2441054.1 hypothetical protein [Agrobacterium vitis]MUZ58488.1 hypothetical protein [Agrobacterium vitis]MVA65818.1 hypothetical protein [Agrobacterium vitis]MVA88160.1 hypothetical protein [Agrobacterium vitis]